MKGNPRTQSNGGNRNGRETRPNRSDRDSIVSALEGGRIPRTLQKAAQRVKNGGAIPSHELKQLTEAARVK